MATQNIGIHAFLPLLIFGLFSLINSYDVFCEESAEKSLLTKDEIVASLQRESFIKEGQETLELVWGITEPSWNNQELFITVHKGESQQVANVYIRAKDRFRLLKTIEAPIGYFEKPETFWYTDSQGSLLHVIHLTAIADGTGQIENNVAF